MAVADDGCVRIVVLGLHHPRATKNLGPLVVTVGRAAAVLDRADYPVSKFQNRDGSIHVTNGADRLVHQHARRGVDLFYLAADEKAGHVEVVNGHVQKQSTRDLDVSNRRWRGVATHNVQLPRPANFALLDGLAHATEIRVEAPIEADLEYHPGSLNC